MYSDGCTHALLHRINGEADIEHCRVIFSGRQAQTRFLQIDKVPHGRGLVQIRLLRRGWCGQPRRGCLASVSGMHESRRELRWNRCATRSC